MNKSIFPILLHRAYASLRTEVSSYYLNFLWWVLEPSLSIGVYYFVFGVFLKRGTDDFVGFLLVGMVFWNWFQRTINNSSNSIMNAKGIMLQVRITKIIFPLEVVLRDCFKNSLVTLLLIVFLVFYSSSISITWTALPILMAVQLFFMTAIAILCAAIVPFIPDLKFVISTGLHLLFFGTGIFYRIDDVVLPEHQYIMYMNPMAGLVKNYREILLYSNWPDWQYLGWVAVAGFVLMFCAISLVRRFDYVYPRVCLR